MFPQREVLKKQQEETRNNNVIEIYSGILRLEIQKPFSMEMNSFHSPGLCQHHQPQTLGAQKNVMTQEIVWKQTNKQKKAFSLPGTRAAPTELANSQHVRDSFLKSI